MIAHFIGRLGSGKHVLIADVVPRALSFDRITRLDIDVQGVSSLMLEIPWFDVRERGGFAVGPDQGCLNRAADPMHVRPDRPEVRVTVEGAP